MKILLLTIGVIIVLGAMGVALGWLVCWFATTHDGDDYVRIRFEHFKALYAVAPSKYRLEDYYVRYGRLLERDHYYIQFSAVDTIRYQIWRHRKIKQIRKTANDDATIKYLKCAQADIERFMKQQDSAKQPERPAAWKIDRVI